MRKLMCFCDRCAVAADWTMRPSRRNLRFFELTIRCHGEAEQLLVAASELLHVAASGPEPSRPLCVIAFEGETAAKSVRIIESDPPNLSIRIPNYTNRIFRD